MNPLLRTPDTRAREVCPTHLVPLRDGGCWACAWGLEPQASCPTHGRYARARGECPTCVLVAMLNARRAA